MKLSANVWASPIACNDEVQVTVDHEGRHTVSATIILTRAELLALLAMLDTAKHEAAAESNLGTALARALQS